MVLKLSADASFAVPRQTHFRMPRQCHPDGRKHRGFTAPRVRHVVAPGPSSPLHRRHVRPSRSARSKTTRRKAPRGRPRPSTPAVFFQQRRRQDPALLPVDPGYGVRPWLTTILSGLIYAWEGRRGARCVQFLDIDRRARAGVVRWARMNGNCFYTCTHTYTHARRGTPCVAVALMASCSQLRGQ